MNGALVGVESAVGELVSCGPALPCHVACVTPLPPAVVSSSFHGRFAALGPRYTVEPSSTAPAGLPAASSNGTAFVSCVIEAEEKVDETPALFVTTIWYA